MTLYPEAVVQGKIDRSRSYFDKIIEYPLISTNTYTQDGQAMISTSEAGVSYEVANVSGGTPSTEKFIGFAVSDFRRITDFVNIETGTIPASPGPYTIQLKKTVGVVIDSVMVTVTATGADYKRDSTASATTRYSATTGGLLTFHSDDKTVGVTIRYLYAITATELAARFPGTAAVQNAQTLLSQVAIATGNCKVYTTNYDTGLGSKLAGGDTAWTIGVGVYTAAAGKVTTATGGMLFGRVVSLPSVGDPYLGIAYNTGLPYTW